MRTGWKHINAPVTVLVKHQRRMHKKSTSWPEEKMDDLRRVHFKEHHQVGLTTQSTNSKAELHEPGKDRGWFSRTAPAVDVMLFVPRRKG